MSHLFIASGLLALTTHCLLVAQTDLIQVTPFKTLPLSGKGDFSVFHPDSALVGVSTAQGFTAYRLDDGQSSLILKCPRGSAVSGAASRDGARVALACQDGTIITGKWIPGSSESEFPRVHSKRIASLSFDPDGSSLVSAGADGVAVVWDVGSHREMFRFGANPKKPFVFAGFREKGLSIVAVTEDGQILERDAKTGRSLRNDSVTENSVFSASLDPSGSLLAIGVELARLSKGAGFGPASPTDFFRQDRVLFYDLAQGRVVKQLDGVDGELKALSISSDARFLAASRQRVKKTYLSIYDVQRGTEVFAREARDGAGIAGFSLDGRYLQSVTPGGELALFKVAGIEAGRDRTSPEGLRIRVVGPSQPLLTGDTKLTIAVMDLDSLHVDKDTGRQVAELLRNRLAGSGIKLVASDRMQEVIRQQNFGFSDRTDSLSAVALGRILNAQKIVFGSVSSFGTTYSVNVQLVDVATAGVEGVRGVMCERCSLEDLPEIVQRLQPVLVGTR